MTEHILNFAISIDDDAIIRNVQNNAHKQIVVDIKKEILRKVFEESYWGKDFIREDGKIDRHNAELSEISKGIIKECIEEHKDEIIEMSAKMIAEKYYRSKAFKDVAGKVTE